MAKGIPLLVAGQARLLGSSLEALVAQRAVRTSHGGPELGEALHRAVQSDADVLIYCSPHLSAREVEAFQGVEIPLLLILGEPPEVELAMRALKNGALGLIPPPCSSSELLAALITIKHRRVVVMFSELMEHLLRQPAHDVLTDASALKRLAVLTPRQRQVLALAAQGYPNQRIADEMNLANSTVRNYLSSAYQRLGCQNRTEAAIIFRELTKS